MNRWFAFVICIALGVIAPAASSAQKEPCATPGENNSFLGIQTVRLWPGDAPGARGKACEDIPTLTILDPQQGHDTGSAVVVLPGGAYRGLAANLEGRQVADWFATRGAPSKPSAGGLATITSRPIASCSSAFLPAAIWLL